MFVLFSIKVSRLEFIYLILCEQEDGCCEQESGFALGFQNFVASLLILLAGYPRVLSEVVLCWAEIKMSLLGGSIDFPCI